MTIYKTCLLLVSVALCSCSKKSSPLPGGGNTNTGGSAPANKVYTFDTKTAWADEFDVAGKPDTSKWAYETGGNGWGNHELEYYTPGNNVDVVNGNMVLTAKKETSAGMNYTSARLLSKGAGNFLYGRFEIRAKVPPGRGTWPAIWMLPTDNAYGNWPNSGEVDIMEHVGYDPDKFYFTIHTGAYNHTLNTQRGTNVSMANATSDYHVFRIDWTPNAITGFIDDQQVYTFKNEGTGSAAWPFDKRFHIMLNIAVGGDWGGAQGVDDTVFPAVMQIDYIRYYPVNNL